MQQINFKQNRYLFFKIKHKTSKKQKHKQTNKICTVHNIQTKEKHTNNMWKCVWVGVGVGVWVGVNEYKRQKET